MKHQAQSFKFRSEIIGIISLIPIFLFHVYIVIIPVFNTFLNSFTNWNGLLRKEFIGLGNYLAMASDPSFWDALMNNVRWMAIFLTIPIGIGLVLGYLITNLPRGKIVFRTCYFLPYVISAAIAGKIFAAFYNPYFGINVLFESLNLAFMAHDWLSPSTVLYSVAFVDIWHWWGFLMVIFIGSLQQIDPMLYESAEVEGAGGFQKFIYITVPCVRQTLVFIILITMVWSISTFEYVWVMTKGSPGSELLSTLLYKNALLKYKAGYACAISVIQALLAFFIFSVFGVLRKRIED
jgi:raffinose/stachyose/melibiose transport system permease protein